MTDEVNVYKFDLTFGARVITDQPQSKDMDVDGDHAEHHAEVIAKDLLRGLKKELISVLKSQLMEDQIASGKDINHVIVSAHGGGGLTVSLVNNGDKT